MHIVLKPVVLLLCYSCSSSCFSTYVGSTEWIKFPMYYKKNKKSRSWPVSRGNGHKYAIVWTKVVPSAPSCAACTSRLRSVTVLWDLYIFKLWCLIVCMTFYCSADLGAQGCPVKRRQRTRGAGKPGVMCRKPYLFGNHRMLHAVPVNKTVPFTVDVIVNSG